RFGWRRTKQSYVYCHEWHDLSNCCGWCERFDGQHRVELDLFATSRFHFEPGEPNQIRRRDRAIFCPGHWQSRTDLSMAVQRQQRWGCYEFQPFIYSFECGCGHLGRCGREQFWLSDECARRLARLGE